MEWVWEALTSPHYIHGNLFFWIFSVPPQNKKVLLSFPLSIQKSSHKGPFSAHNGKKNKKKSKKYFFFRKKFQFWGIFLPKKKSISSLPYFSTLSSPPPEFCLKTFWSGSEGRCCPNRGAKYFFGRVKWKKNSREGLRVDKYGNIFGRLRSLLSSRLFLKLCND